MRPGFSVHKVGLLDTLQVFVLLQVLAHLHVFWVGLEIGVGSRRRLVGLLQLRGDGGKPSWWRESKGSHNLRTVSGFLLGEVDLATPCGDNAHCETFERF